MNEWIGLESIIKQNIKLYANSPALDPIIIDKFDRPLNEVTHDALAVIRSRLFNAGFRKYNQAIIAKRETIQELKKYNLQKEVRLITSNRANGYLYILTGSADRRLFIHPPYKEDHSIMSWDEYFERVAKGEKLNFMVEAPWAQARITIE